MLQGQVGGWAGGLRGWDLGGLPLRHPKDLDHPKPSFSSFFISREIAVRLENYLKMH